MIDLAEFTEIPLNERDRKLAFGQIILIDKDQQFSLQHPLRREQIKPRDPKLSRTLNPPFGEPMFKQDAELDKWVRREMQKSGGRLATETSQTAATRTNRHNH